MHNKKDIIIVAVIVFIIGALIIWFVTAPKTPGTETEAQETPTAAPTIESYAYDPNNPAQADISAILPDGTVATGNIIVVQSANASIETYSTITFTAVPAGVKIPEIYSRLLLPDIDVPVYAYTDTHGETKVRAYGYAWRLKNNVQTEKIEGYYAIELAERDAKICIRSAEYTPIVQDTEKDAAIYERKGASERNLDTPYKEESANLYAAYNNNGALMYRTFANLNENTVVCPCDSKGGVRKGALPVLTENERAYLLDKVPGEKADDETETYPTEVNGIVVTVVK